MRRGTGGVRVVRGDAPRGALLLACTSVCVCADAGRRSGVSLLVRPGGAPGFLRGVVGVICPQVRGGGGPDYLKKADFGKVPE